MSTPSPNEPERLVTGYSGRIAIILAVGVMVVNLGRQALPPLLVQIIQDFQITEAQAGFALTVLWGVYSLLQYPAGRFADELSRKTGLAIGLVVMVGGFSVLLPAAGYPALLAGAALIGSGAAFYMLGQRTLLSDLYVGRRGQAFGLNIAVGQIGSILAGGLAAIAVGVATWRAAFLPVVLLLVAVLLALHWYSREPYRIGLVRPSIRRSVGRVFGSGHIRRLVVGYSLVIFTWQGTIGFLPTFLQVQKGFSFGLATGSFASVFVVGLFVQPLAGAASDRTGRLPVAGASVVIAAAGLIVVVVGWSSWLILSGVVVFAIGLLGFPPVMQAYLMDVFPEESKGGDLGAFKTVYEGLGSLGPTYVGLAIGAVGYLTAFGGFVVCLLASAGIVLWSGYTAG